MLCVVLCVPHNSAVRAGCCFIAGVTVVSGYLRAQTRQGKCLSIPLSGNPRPAEDPDSGFPAESGIGDSLFPGQIGDPLGPLPDFGDPLGPLPDS